jgi:hypothetical protein
MSPLTHLDFRSEVVFALVAVVDEASLVADEARVDSASVIAEVVEVVGLPQSLSNAFQAKVDDLANISADELFVFDGMNCEES